MRLSSLIMSLAAAVSVIASPAAAEPEIVGAVERVQETVTATQRSKTRALALESPVLFRDRLSTGPRARLEAKLADGTTLTLGEKGSLVVDEFAYQPFFGDNKLALRVERGAFLFVGGAVEDPSGQNVTIKTPVGTLGVRGTTVWGGHIDGGYGVLVLDGEVKVQTSKGAVMLKAGQGTMVYDGRSPDAPGAWPADRTRRAVRTITFSKWR